MAMRNAEMLVNEKKAAEDEESARRQNVGAAIEVDGFSEFSL